MTLMAKCDLKNNTFGGCFSLFSLESNIRNQSIKTEFDEISYFIMILFTYMREKVLIY